MDIHQQALIEAAEKRGIQVEILSEKWGMDAVAYQLNGKKVLVIEGRIYPGLSVQQDMIAENKAVCKALFQSLEIPTPSSLTFTDFESSEERLTQFMYPGKKYVCKPTFGTEGEAIAMFIEQADDIRWHCERYEEIHSWMLEEQVSGEDLRIQVIGKKVVAACLRIPATLTGDGVHSLEALLEQKNHEIQAQNPQNRIEIDAATRILLSQQALYLSSVPEAGQKVQLKFVANLSQGATAIDVTDSLHEIYRQWAEKISQELNLDIFALDVITPSHQEAASEAVALEINVRPQWLHHTFSEGKTHDIPNMILDQLLK